MAVNDPAYERALDYLVRYATEDWVMMPVLVSEARGVAGRDATKRQVMNTMVDLASSLLDHQVEPGDLGEDFEPWSGSREQRLERLRAGLDAMLAADELPVGPDICWFHKIDS